MALFKRKQTTYSDDMPMPQELQEYYSAESRSNNWMAWVLGLATLLVTVVVALGLFYGGRYAYRKIRSNDTNKNKTAQQETNKDQDKDKGEETTEESTPSESNSSTSTPQTSSTSTNTPGTATTPTTSSAVAGANASDNMPKTGPESTIAVFMAVSVLGYLAHRKFLAE